MSDTVKCVIIITIFIVIALSPVILMNIFDGLPSYFIALELIIAPEDFIIFVFLLEKDIIKGI